MKQLFRVKTTSPTRDPQDTSPPLQRTLGSWDVTALGVGAIVGGGIFATLGTAAVGDVTRPGAGPSLTLSFAVIAVVCAFTALCYAELASMFPVSGSAYSYAYAAFGELVAWMIGWNLVLEYTIANVAVAVSWGNYARALLHVVGVDIPPWLATDPRTPAQHSALLAQAPTVFGVPVGVNLPAIFVMAILTLLLVRGTRESARLNNVFVVFKIAVLLFFVGLALNVVSPTQMASNWQPFLPNGWHGMFTGAAIVFFSFIGFDSVSTVSEEARDPARTIPRGILGSLALCALLYCIVAAAFTGLLPFPALQQELAQGRGEPLTAVLARVAPDKPWALTVVAVGALVAQTTALLAFQVAQSRIFFAMARDGLLPPLFGKVHPRHHTPYVATYVAGALVGGLAAFANIDEMIDLSNVGTLFAFAVVCLGVIILRLREPERPRPFSVPGGAFFVPLLGCGACLFLTWYLPPASWWRFAGWLAVGAAVYAVYGYRHSAMAKHDS
jgi:basic amino acid/polyamine antiporter, APA family